MSSASMEPLVHSTGLYDPKLPRTESSTHESMTTRSHPEYRTNTTSFAARDSKLDMSVASHSMMKGRSWFFGLQRFCPAKVSPIFDDWTSEALLVPGGALPPQAARVRAARARHAVRGENPRPSLVPFL